MEEELFSELSEVPIIPEDLLGSPTDMENIPRNLQEEGKEDS